MKVKAILILTIITLITCSLGKAQQVDEKTAMKAAENWYRHYAPEHKKAATVAKSSEYTHNGRTAFYIFNFDAGGFALISANEAVTPVLGYGFEHAAPEEITNEAVKWWLDNYARQIDTAFVLNLKNEAATLKWSEVLENRMPSKSGNGVGPLLTTTWDQGWPYNAMCPEDTDGPGGHTWAGCTAVAMAQILKFWNYPEGGVGHHSYLPRFNPQYGLQSVFFNETDYAWDEMENTATSENYEAISTLMYHVGVSSDMDYSTSGSGAHLYRAVYGFKRNFDFSDSIVQEYRSGYNDWAWIYLLKENLNHSRPVLKEGYNEGYSFGHAFVCDGYDENDLIHINWGWSGSFNGFWHINDLTPFFKFNHHQSALVNIFPNYSELSARFKANQTDINYAMQYIDFSTGNPESFYWDFGDSNFSEYQNPIHEYEQSGNYLVKLVIHKSGVFDTIQRQQHVCRKPFLKANIDLQGNDGKNLGVDYNDDNKHDIIITGHNGTRFYDNINDTFELIETNFPQMSISPSYLKSIDLTNTNKPQFLLTGRNGFNASQKYSFYFRFDQQIVVYDTLFNVQLPTDKPFSFADYDNDGNIDLLLGNKLYKNWGEHQFEYVCDIGDIEGASAWCDFDLDGFADVAIGGRLFRNNGKGIFSEMGVTYSYSNTYEWGDFNGDGYPDLLTSNNILINLNGDSFSIYTFETNLPIFVQGINSTWADIDNDGDIDVISIISGVNCCPTTYVIATNIYMHVQDSLVFLDSSLQPLRHHSSMSWIDYDNNSSVDLLLTGYYMSDIYTGNGNNWISHLYKNNSISNNQPPSIPENLQSDSIGTNSIFLSWDRSYDDTTPQSSLSYNVYIYNVFDSVFIVSPLSDTVSGFLKTPRMGNAYLNNFIELYEIPPGTYYWSVQAIDNSFAGGPFAPEQSFAIMNPLCSEPFLVSLTSLNSTSALISWSQVGGVDKWDIVYGYPGFNPEVEGILFENIEEKHIELAGLTPGKGYTCYIRAKCDDGSSGWSRPLHFTTNCAQIAYPFYNEDFDTLHKLTIPTCWYANGKEGHHWEVFVDDKSSFSSPKSLRLYHECNSYVTIVSKQIGGDLNSHRMKFKALRGTSPGHGKLFVGTVLNPYDFETFSLLQEFEIIHKNGQPWHELTVYFSNNLGPNTHLAFRLGSDENNEWAEVFIDDIVIQEAPFCFEPYMIEVNSITLNEANITWCNIDSVLMWDLIYGVMDFDLSTEGILVQGLVQPNFLIQGLDHSSSYKCYIRAYCENELSDWSDPFYFDSECIVNEFIFDEPLANVVYNLQENFQIPLSFEYSGCSNYYSQVFLCDESLSTIDLIVEYMYFEKKLSYDFPYFPPTTLCSGNYCFGVFIIDPISYNFEMYFSPMIIIVNEDENLNISSQIFEGAEFKPGQQIPIKWNSSSDSPVNILYSLNDGESWTMEVSNLFTECKYHFQGYNTYEWTIPPEIVGVFPYSLIRIENSINTSVSVQSPHFTINSIEPVVFMSPNHGDIIQYGDDLIVKLETNLTCYVFLFLESEDFDPIELTEFFATPKAYTLVFNTADFQIGSTYRISLKTTGVTRWYHSPMFAITGGPQTIQIPEGWSGISSYIYPVLASIEDLFDPILDKLIILQSFTGFYFPGQNINSIGNWNNHDAFWIKVDADTQLTISGYEENLKTYNYSMGWNLIPVISNVPANAEALFEEVEGNLIILKDVAATGVYWPEYGINTIGHLIPGEAYYVKMLNSGSVTFPPYDFSGLKTGADWLKPAEIVSPWGGVTRTPSSHTIAIPANVSLSLQEESIIGAFTTEGLLAGLAKIDHTGGNVLVLQMDDPLTPDKDGCVEGELMTFKLWDDQINQEQLLLFEFDTNLPDHTGQFVPEGLSAVKSITIAAGDSVPETYSEWVRIIPNPAKDEFTIYLPESWEGTMVIRIFTMDGQPVKMVTTLEMEQRIHIGGLSAGVYLVEVSNEDKTVTRRLIKH